MKNKIIAIYVWRYIVDEKRIDITYTSGTLHVGNRLLAICRGLG